MTHRKVKQRADTYGALGGALWFVAPHFKTLGTTESSEGDSGLDSGPEGEEQHLKEGRDQLGIMYSNE